MQQPLDEHGSPQRWIFFLLIAGLIAITTLFIVSRLFEYSGPELLNSPYSAKTEPKIILIGDIRFTVPENMIRRPEQREDAMVQQLDLVMLWPELEGFTRDNQVHFSNSGPDSRLIYATLSQPEQILSSSERLYTVYSEHFDGDPISGPARLIGFAMDPKSSFAGETVYFKPDESEPFVARCVQPVKGSPTFCMRDIMLTGKVQLSYRFRLPLLKEWKRMDETIKDRVTGFVHFP
ncbi:hypothetical protein SAMN04515647_4506 [Cohaesibacter sp. ES.047]|uniref:hypothetical protein n=1 Tax=Cohaesibacter sp. ES.047 TaxID=1798205 RepID=UPI000BB863D8|nr:hypothetical protein [Cohaesibacter sp. ES.047]SNY94182.1 hypothetical protein SAMN04515647_4506 [Cohaesibacter sp. ES.047]